MKITILGKGAFGTAMGLHLSKKGHEIVFDEAKDSKIIFVCVPSNAVIKALGELGPSMTNQKIVICSKGFAEEGRLLSVALKEKFKGKIQNEIFFLYGPTLADEIRQGMFSGMVLAGGKEKDKIKKEIESENLYIELSGDVVGVEISAALKNVMAIFIGLVEGAGYGQNTRAFIFTKAVEEMKNIGLKLGARSETFLGLSCVGDLFLTSRNRLLGVELGKGRKLEDIIKESNYTPAGVFALKDAQMMLEKYKIEAPIIKSLQRVIYENYPVKDAIKHLFWYK